MGPTKRSKAEEVVEQAEDTHAPADTSSHKHGAASRTIHLEGVPLLDSPAWSSEDELDNPTYNKRFRHRKHEEIRQRLQQRKLEARERQQQQQQQPDHLPPQRRASTPQRAHSHSVGSEEVITTTKAAHPGKRTPSGGNPQADGPASTLERTNTAHSRRSKRSNATQHSQRPRKRDTDDVGAAAKRDVAAAPRSGGGGGASAPAAESPAVSGVTAASAAVTSVPLVPPPVPAAEPEKAVAVQAAMSTEAAAGTKAESPGKSAPLVNGHAASQQDKELSRLVDDHRHTEQPAAPTQAAKSEKTSSASPPLRLAEAKAAALPPAPAPAPAPAPQTVAFSSTEVQPPTISATTRGTHTPAPRFSLQKKIKGNTKATSSAASSAVPPQAAEKRSAAPPPPPPPPPPLWAEVLSAKEAVVVAPAPPPLPRTFAKTIITVHQQSPSSPRTNGVASLDSSSFDGAASMPTALDTTRQFVEADLQGERPPVQRSAAASPNGTASATTAAKRPPARGEAAATTVPAAVMEDTHIAEPPLSPLPSSTEPLQLHADEVVAPLSVPTSARSPPRVERRSHSSSVTSNGQPGAAAASMTTQRQHRRSDYYTFSGIPSCFDFMLTGGERRTEGEAAKTATGGAAAALPVTLRASGSTEGRVRVSHDVSFSSADGFSDGNGSYNYEIGEMYEIGGAEEEEEDEEAETSSSGSMHDAASWGDILSPTSVGSDVDYILAYHSSYYGDLLRHLEMTPSRESPAIDGDAAAPAFAKDDAAPDAAVAVLAGPVVRDQTRAATEQPTKPSSRSSTQSAQSSSLGSLDRARHFCSGDVPQSAAPPAYSFYTHLQESRDGHPLTQSQGDFDQDMTALGVADALPSTKKTRNPAEGFRGSSTSAEDADSWGYYWAKKESWPAISRTAKARKKSSSMISAKYSLLSSKKGISMRRSSQLVKQAAKVAPAPAPAPAAVPPPASAPVRVLSLQTPVQRVPPSLPATQALPPPPQPAVSSVKPLSLENFGSQTVTDSKAFDLHSPVVRKMTAPPEELAGLAGEEDEGREETAVHMVGQQHQQEQLQPQQPTLFSFAGLAVHPPAALRAKRRAAALMGPAAAATAKQPAARDEPTVQRPPSVPPAVLLESTDTTATPTLAALLPAEASYGDQRVSKTEEEAGVAEEAPPQLPLAGPPPATPEPRRFRSLIGSAYLTDVYTSSLRQLTSQRRTTRAVLPGQTAEPAVKETAGVDGGAFRGGAPGSHLAFKQPPGLPPLDTTHLAAAVAEAGNDTTTTPIFAADDSGRTAATTSTTDAAASPPHRYRRRHHRTTRIDALFAETAMRNSGCSVDGGGSCPLPQPPVCAVRVAGQGSGRAVEAVQALSQLSSAQRRSASGTALPVRTSNGGIAGSAPLPSDQAGRKASDAETLSGRGWVAPQFLPGRTAATTRSGSSFLRMVASPPSGTSPVVRQTPAAATAGMTGGRVAPQPQSQPQPAYIAVEVAPVSVSAMVRRLEANMSAVNAPMAAMVSVKGQRPPQPTRHTVSDRRVAAASTAPPGGVAGESSSAAASRQVLSSTQRPVSSCRSDNSNLVKSEAVLNDFTERKGALRTLATLPQRTAASPTLNGNGTHRGGGHAIEQASTSPMNGSRTTTTTAFASVNQPPVNRADDGPNGTKVFSPPPSSSSPPPLTREALMRQQAQQTMIVRDQHGPQSPPHLQPLPVATASSPSPQQQQQQQQPLPQLRRRDAAGPPSHCNTTEDLLTRITVLGDRRGWSGRPDASIVSTLHSAPSEPPSTASSPTAAGTEQRRAASEAPSPHARERLPGPGDRQREERGCRYQPLQLTHVFGDEGAVPKAGKTTAAVRQRALEGPSD